MFPLSLLASTGFCAVSKTIPLPWLVHAETTVKPVAQGMHVVFGQEVHCVAAEPHATFLRIGIMEAGRELAFESAVLGRLRGGFRVFQLRGILGTRIELAYLFVRISFGGVSNLWPTPRQLRQRARASDSGVSIS